MWISARLIFVYLTSLTCLKSNSQTWLLHLGFYERADKKCASLSHHIKPSWPRAQINEWMSLNVALPNEAGPMCRNGFRAEDHLKVPQCQALSLCLLSDWPEAVHSPRNATWKVSKQGGLGKTNVISVQEAKFAMLMLEWWAALSTPLWVVVLFRPSVDLELHSEVNTLNLARIYNIWLGLFPGRWPYKSISHTINSHRS